MKKYAAVTLVLSREYKPIFFQDIKKAFINAYLNKVQVIEYYPIEIFKFKTVDRIYEVPMIIRTNTPYKHFISKVPTRLAIFIRDNYTCAYCGKRCNDDEITIDHIIPSSKNGKWTWENLVTCCIDCNRKKKDNIWKPKFVKPGRIEHFFIQLSKYYTKLYPSLIEFTKSYIIQAEKF